MRKTEKSREAFVRRRSVKKVFLKISQNSQEKSSTRVSFKIKLQTWGLQLYLKETLAQVFSCECCKIFMNTFFYRTLLVSASESSEVRQSRKTLISDFPVFWVLVPKIYFCRIDWEQGCVPWNFRIFLIFHYFLKLRRIP